MKAIISSLFCLSGLIATMVASVLAMLISMDYTENQVISYELFWLLITPALAIAGSILIALGLNRTWKYLITTLSIPISASLSGWVFYQLAGLGLVVKFLLLAVLMGSISLIALKAIQEKSD